MKLFGDNSARSPKLKRWTVRWRTGSLHRGVRSFLSEISESSLRQIYPTFAHSAKGAQNSSPLSLTLYSQDGKEPQSSRVERNASLPPRNRPIPRRRHARRRRERLLLRPLPPSLAPCTTHPLLNARSQRSQHRLLAYVFPSLPSSNVPAPRHHHPLTHPTPHKQSPASKNTPPTPSPPSSPYT